MASGPNWKSSAILGVVAVAVGAAAWLNESVWKPKKDAKEKNEDRVFNLQEKSKPVGIKKIRIVTQAATFQFDCKDDVNQKCKPGDKSHWSISEPTLTPADDAVIDSLLSSVDNLQATDSISLADETPESSANLLKEYGLDEGAISSRSAKLLEITTAKDTVQKVYFGSMSPIGDTTYAWSSLEPKKIWLTPSYFKAQFDKDLSAWRDKKLFAFTAADITGFELATGKIKLKGERTPNSNAWILDGKYPADAQAMDGFLNTVAYLHAEKFVAEDKTQAKAKALLKGQPAYRIKIKTKEEAELVLYRGDKQAYGSLSTAPFVYEFNAAIPNRLTKELKDLRQSKLLLTTERMVSGKMEWTHPKLGAFTVELKDKQWKVVSPTGSEPADDQAVSNVLDRLSSPIIKDYRSSLPGAAQLSCKIWDKEGKLQREFKFSKQGARVFAQELSDKNSLSFELDSSLNLVLPWDKNIFLKAKAAGAKP